MKKSNIAIFGAGYVGFSLALLLAKKNNVLVIDNNQEKVELINSGKIPFEDNEIFNYFSTENLNLSSSSKITSSVNFDAYIIAVPTNYDHESQYFDTSIVKNVIRSICNHDPKAFIVIKSTVPVGFSSDIQEKFPSTEIVFSPEFLREGQSLHDNFYPSRIVMGGTSKKSKEFAKMLLSFAQNTPEVLFMTNTEAESVKLFSNTYLAMRITFFNELDNFAINKKLDTTNLIKGVSSDSRIGDYYNNPSFGYGGYCLPKDTKQLLANYKNVPQTLIRSVVESNAIRKDFIANEIINLQPKCVGIYRLVMKSTSSNFRDSAVQGIMKRIKSKGIKVIVYEPNFSKEFFFNSKVVNDLQTFKDESDLIVANRMHDEILDVRSKTFSRDIFGIN